MALVRKFTFDCDFSVPLDLAPPPDAEPDEGGEAAAEPEPPPPTYSGEDLATAREEGYAAGREAALAESEAVAQKTAAEALSVIARELASVREEVGRTAGEVAELAVRAATEICRKLLPHTADEFAVREVEAVMVELLPLLLNEPRVMVRVHSRLAAEMEKRLTAAAEEAGFEGRIVVLGEEAFAADDVRVEWADGGAERNTSQLWKEIDRLIDRVLPRFSRAQARQIEAEESTSEPENEVAAEPEPETETKPKPKAGTRAEAKTRAKTKVKTKDAPAAEAKAPAKPDQNREGTDDGR